MKEEIEKLIKALDERIANAHLLSEDEKHTFEFQCRERGKAFAFQWSKNVLTEILNGKKLI